MEDTEEITEFCTIREAAQRSGLASKTWYQGGAGTADVPRVRFGRSIRLRRKDVEKFISDRIVEAERATKTIRSAGVFSSEDQGVLLNLSEQAI